MVVQQEQKSPHECRYKYANINGATWQKNELSINQFLIRIKFYSATDWTVQGLNPNGGDFPQPPDRGRGSPSLPYNGYRAFLGVKQPRRSVNHPPHLWVVVASAPLNFILLNSIALTKNHVETFQRYWPATNLRNLPNIDYSLVVSKHNFFSCSQLLPVLFVSYIQAKLTN